MNMEQARQLIIEGELLSADRCAERLQQFTTGGGDDNDVGAFVRFLVEQHELSDFQGAAVLAGIRGPYMLGPYKVTSQIAAGRLGDIFHAEHVEYSQPVSLKVFPATLSKNRERLARLGREARVSLQVDHLHVMKTFHVGRIGNVPFIAFEELSGETLEHRLARDRRLPYAEACQLIHQAALGLDYLHSQDIVHRDICPANLWVTSHGMVKIMDFGAARDAMSFLDSLDGDGGELTMSAGGLPNSTDVLGRYDYMSAEQAEDPHAANAVTDLYSLGCTLYHCLTGQAPFPEKNPVRQMLKHAKDAPRPLDEFDPEIPQAVQDIVSKLLAKNPADRYQSGDDVAAALALIVPPAVLPELDPLNAEFLEWIREDVSQKSEEVPEVVEYEPAFADFLNFVSAAKFDSILAGRPTF